MRMQCHSASRLFIILPLILTGLAAAQTFFWNPSAPLLTSGSGDVLKAYNWSSAAGGGAYPNSTLDDDFASGTLNPVWTVRDADGFTDTPNPYINFTDNPGQLTIRASGKDVWQADNQFVGITRSDITGDFDVSVEVVSQTDSVNSTVWAKAGILMRNNFAPTTDSAGFAMVAVTPGNGFTFQWDADNNGALEAEVDTKNASSVLASYPCWLRLAKKGTSVTAYYKTALNNAWTQIDGAKTLTSALVNSKIALFVTSHITTKTSTVVFDDFKGGGNITSTALDLNFGGGTGAQAGSDARLTAPLTAKSVAFKSSKVAFDFLTSALTVSDSAIFAAAKSVAAGTGSILFTGNGAQKLAPLAGSALPAVSKSGTGTLTLAGTSMTAGLLTLSGGTLNCGNNSQEFAGLNATGGATITGLDAADTLTFSADANFSGVTALPAAGTIALRAASTTLNFTPPTAPAAVFNNLILWPRPLTASGAIIAVGAGTISLGGDLIFRDEKVTSTGNGDIDFRMGNANVTSAGSASRTDFGSGTANKLRLYMGKGTWALKGDLNINPPNGLTADSAALDFQATSPAVQNLTAGTWMLGNITHSGTGTLNLAQSSATLKASSYSQSAGVLNLNGSNLQTTDSLIVRNGVPGSILGLGGKELKSAGNIFLSGTSAARLGLNPGSIWKATAGGTLNADWADLAGSDASLSAAAGTATANCNDLGGNTHWNFPPTGPSFTLQPVSKEVVAGLPVVFKAKATGTAPVTYAWHAQGDTTTLSKEDSLHFDKVDPTQNGIHYYCVATNSVGNAPSLDAVLTVDLPPVIDAQPADTTVVAGKTASFTVTAHGTGTLVYTWTKVGDAVVLPKGATLSLDTGSVRKYDGGTFICTITNGFGSAAVTRAALLTVKYPPSIARQPADVVGTLGQKATLSISATGTAPLVFAWTRAGDTATLSKDSILTLGPLALADTNSYQCHVTNNYGSSDSRVAKLSVVQAATIVREPSDMTVGPGRKAYFIAGVAGAQPLTYAWRRKGSATVIGTDTLLVIDSAKLADNGAIFIFTVSNSYGSDTSREAKLSVIACDSVFKITPESLTVDEGQPVKLAGTAACASERQWSVVSGPGPRILDPEIDTLTFVAPRVSGDSVIVLRFSAQYFGGPAVKDIRIKVREAIPDPMFTLPPPGKWKGSKTYVVRPTLTNSAALKASKYSPPLHYLWSLSAQTADTALGGDSLQLSNPTQGGNLDVTLCMDNGGAALCVVHTVDIDLMSVSLALRAARFGPVSLSGRMLAWNTKASVRIWDFRGRILWQDRREAGASALLPEAAARDLLRGRARLEILP